MVKLISSWYVLGLPHLRFPHMLCLLDYHYHHLCNGNILPAFMSNSCNFTTLLRLSPTIPPLPESGLFLFRIGLLCLVSIQLTVVASAQPVRCIEQRQMVHPAGVPSQPRFSWVIQSWPRKYSIKLDPNCLPALHPMLREGYSEFRWECLNMNWIPVEDENRMKICNLKLKK